MRNQWLLVKLFNKAFKVKESVKPTPRIPDNNRNLSHRLLQEELDEYWEAMVKADMVKIADALIDIQYVLIGAMIKHGIDFELFEKLFQEVHDSNMSKLDDSGEPITRDDGKVLKGKGYFKPNLSEILNKQ